MSNIQRFADKQTLSAEAASLFIRSAAEAIAERGEFHVVLAGGSTPAQMYRMLAAQPDKVYWAKVHVYWGDERHVPPDHEDSNYRMAKETLLDHVPVSTANIHRIRGEVDAEDAAKEYGLLLKDKLTDKRFDLVLLGMGDDGHTLSLFPHTAGLKETKHRVIANHVDKLNTTRITLTPRLVNEAGQVVFLVAGENKADALAQVLQGDDDPETYPAQLIRNDNLIWLVDEAAAFHLSL